MKHLSDRAEELLEHIWISLEELKRPADMNLVVDNDELRMLSQLNLVRTGPEGITLTDAGRKEAIQCVRRHRLAERLLSDILDSGDEEIHAAGCKFEHGLHRGLEEKVCTMLGHPRTCPHGKPIPPGDCCRRMDKEAKPLMASVADLKSGESAVIAYLHSGEIDDMRKLLAIGALPGKAIILIQRFPSFLLDMGASQFAIDEHMARQIIVRRK